MDCTGVVCHVGVEVSYVGFKHSYVRFLTCRWLGDRGLVLLSPSHHSFAAVWNEEALKSQIIYLLLLHLWKDVLT